MGPVEKHHGDQVAAFSEFYAVIMEGHQDMRCHPHRIVRLLGYLAWVLQAQGVIKYPRPGARSDGPIEPRQVMARPIRTAKRGPADDYVDNSDLGSQSTGTGTPGTDDQAPRKRKRRREYSPSLVSAGMVTAATSRVPSPALGPPALIPQAPDAQAMLLQPQHAAPLMFFPPMLPFMFPGPGMPMLPPSIPPSAFNLMPPMPGQLTSVAATLPAMGLPIPWLNRPQSQSQPPGQPPVAFLVPPPAPQTLVPQSKRSSPNIIS